MRFGALSLLFVGAAYGLRRDRQAPEGLADLEGIYDNSYVDEAVTQAAAVHPQQQQPQVQPQVQEEQQEQQEHQQSQTTNPRVLQERFEQKLANSEAADVEEDQEHEKLLEAHEKLQKQQIAAARLRDGQKPRVMVRAAHHKVETRLPGANVRVSKDERGAVIAEYDVDPRIVKKRMREQEKRTSNLLKQAQNSDSDSDADSDSILLSATKALQQTQASLTGLTGQTQQAPADRMTAQCNAYVSYLKGQAVSGPELVAMWKNTCNPAVMAGTASPQYEMMCSSIVGAVQPFVNDPNWDGGALCVAVINVMREAGI